MRCEPADLAAAPEGADTVQANLARDGRIAAVERQILFAEHLARVEPAEIIVLHAYAPPEHYANYAGYEQLLGQYRVVAQAVVDEAVSART